MTSHLSEPHGGTLVDLMVPEARRAELRAASRTWPSWTLTARQSCDLELLMNGAFSPLRGFMGRADYEHVCADMRLADGTLWPIPVTLDVKAELAAKLAPGGMLALRDEEGLLVAALHVGDVWQPDRTAEAQAVYGTTEKGHPGAAHVMERAHPFYVGGRVEGLVAAAHPDYADLRQTPAELRQEFARRGWTRVVAFQTRNPLHRAHHAITARAAKTADAHLLIHPSVGMTKPGDVDHYTRVRCYQALLPHYGRDAAALSLLNLAMRMGGPREALWHAIIRKNHGCTHFIVGRDHAGPGNAANGKPFYGPYDAQELLRKHEAELGVKMVPFQAMVYLEGQDTYVPDNEVPAGAQVRDISGTALRKLLEEGRDIPTWFTFPEVARELRKRYPPRVKQGFTVFFTGLSGAGKSTIAKVLQMRFLAETGRPVTLLDGDVMRQSLSSELGFSKEHRDLNIKRLAYVAAEITKNGGITICAPIAPYDRARKDARAAVGETGGFVLVHVATSLELCEQRDTKGLYAKARAGLVQGFTGINDPYEAPTDADLVIDTQGMTPNDSTAIIISHLRSQGYLSATPAV